MNQGRRVVHYRRASLDAMKVRDIIKQVVQDGWYQVGQTGSHRQFKHPQKPGKVTIAGHPADEMAPGTYHNILKQAGLK